MVQTAQTSYQKLYYPKRTPQQTLGIILVIIGTILLLAYGLGLIFLVPGILLWYYGRERCPYCKTRGTLHVGSTNVVSQERGFGIVTRTDVVSGRVGNRRQNSTVQRQERVPVVKTTTRVTYECGSCRRLVGSRDYYSQQEDFSPLPQQTVVQREIQREVTERVLITCAHCGNRYPQGTPRCANCGASL